MAPLSLLPFYKAARIQGPKRAVRPVPTVDYCVVTASESQVPQLENCLNHDLYLTRL